MQEWASEKAASTTLAPDKRERTHHWTGTILKTRAATVSEE